MTLAILVTFAFFAMKPFLSDLALAITRAFSGADFLTTFLAIAFTFLAVFFAVFLLRTFFFADFDLAM